MIIGVGHDVVEIARIRKILAGTAGERFMHRTLTDAEYERAKSKGESLAEYVAGRFAVKEAVVKALGCGIGTAVGFKDIEVLPDKLGKPVCTICDEALLRLKLEYPIRLHVSISHERSLASAFAIAEHADRMD
ncbi:holo-[acyl-carrier-protein] synthase [Paenibacillus sambharensis]|uniref:Holo-[acyl-carrier-protein] synthase n=1 Tax=Paenibacillus sambharensis TaxID=1803190 RepID=A0A2W1L823_9BACL|nr:holo-ACP synthase [Paenibacillus sambharensis]PZD94969.1 holo-[acyl-carrier-protein] synthase [Paenibacillus sambharensis]